MVEPNKNPNLGVSNLDIILAIENKQNPNVFKYASNASLAPNAALTVWTPTSGKKFRVMGGIISTTLAAPIIIKDGASGTIFSHVLCPANDSKSINFMNGYLSTTVGNILEVTNASSTTCTVRVSVFGTEE